MPKWFEKILKYNPREKLLKAPFAIYLDLECLLKKEQLRQNHLEQSHQNNNLEKSYTKKKARHEPSGWAMLLRCSFDEEENKLDYCRGKDCIEKLCKKLKERVMKIINYEEKMITLTNEENKSYEEQEACYICNEKFCANESDEIYKNRRKVKDHCHYNRKFRGPAHSICNLKYKVPEDIPIVIN